MVQSWSTGDTIHVHVGFVHEHVPVHVAGGTPGTHCHAHALNFREILEIGYLGDFLCNGDVTFVEFLQPQYSLV